MTPADALFTPRFFLMCAFTFTVFLSLFQLIPTAPFHVRDLGGGALASGLFLGFLTFASAWSGAVHGCVRRPERPAAHADRREPLAGGLHRDLRVIHSYRCCWRSCCSTASSGRRCLLRQPRI